MIFSRYRPRLSDERLDALEAEADARLAAARSVTPAVDRIVRELEEEGRRNNYTPRIELAMMRRRGLA